MVNFRNNSAILILSQWHLFTHHMTSEALGFFHLFTLKVILCLSYWFLHFGRYSFFVVLLFSYLQYKLFSSLLTVKVSLSYCIATAFPSLRDNWHSFKFRGCYGSLKLVLDDWASKDTDGFPQKIFFYPGSLMWFVLIEFRSSLEAWFSLPSDKLFHAETWLKIQSSPQNGWNFTIRSILLILLCLN